MFRMPAPAVPSTTQLADELERVSYYGVGHAMGDLTESEISHLAAIARRLAPDPMGRLRVSIALAVRKAVLLLDPPKHVEAASSLLWLDLQRTDYDEDKSRKRKTLKERHPEVACLLGYKLSSYERHKKWRSLYEPIAHNLLALFDAAESSAQPAEPLDQAPSDAGEHGLAELSSLASAGAELYYAALTSLFVAEFHNECAVNEQLLNPRLFDWDDAAECLFSAFSRFLGRQNKVFAENDLTPDPLNEILKVVPPWAAFHLDQVMRLAELCGPYASHTMLFDIKSYGVLLDRGLKGGPMTLASDKFHVLTLYHGAWIPWFRVQFTGGASVWPPPVDQAIPEERLRPPSICLLAAIGERTVTMIAEHIELRRPVLTDARKQAQRRIATFYDIDEWRPLGANSLHDRTDRFFDMENYQLATGPRTWYNKNENIESLEEQCANVRREWIKDVKRLWDPDGTSSNS
jgi:hypothetical protein